MCDANGGCEVDVFDIVREGDSRWELIKQRESIDLTAGLERRLRLPVRESRGWIQRSSRAKKVAAIVVWERQAALAQAGPCPLVAACGSHWLESERYLSRQCPSLLIHQLHLSVASRWSHLRHSATLQRRLRLLQHVWFWLDDNPLSLNISVAMSVSLLFEA